jgi:hypothetical protein
MIHKIYEVKGRDRCVMSTVYMGVRVNLEFKGGDTLARKDGSLSTTNPFVQAAIEAMPSFGTLVRLVSTNEIQESKPAEAPVENARVKKATAKKKMVDGKESFVVYEVKNINDAVSYFEGLGVLVESKEHLKEVMEKHNVVFPNMSK